MVEAERELRRVEVVFPNSENVHLVCLSIRALLWSLRNATANRDYTILIRSSMELSPSPYLGRLLVERGMCPHYLRVFEKRSSVATLHYLAGFHGSYEMHRICSFQSCVANILDPSKYETRHVNDD